VTGWNIDLCGAGADRGGDKADRFFGCHTSGRTAQAAMPDVVMMPLPQELAVSPADGTTALNDASLEARSPGAAHPIPGRAILGDQISEGAAASSSIATDTDTDSDFRFVSTEFDDDSRKPRGPD